MREFNVVVFLNKKYVFKNILVENPFKKLSMLVANLLLSRL